MNGGKTSFYDEIEKNKRNSFILGALVFAVLLFMIFVISQMFFPEATVLFVIFALLFSTGYVFTTYMYGDKIVLATTNSKPVNIKTPKGKFLQNTVEGLAIAAGIPTPKAYVIESNELNAFATGRDPSHASIAVTTGLIDKLNRIEMECVIGHEMAHIKNYDIRFATVIAVMVGLIAMLAFFLRSYFWFGGGRGRREGGGHIAIIVIGLLLAFIAPLIVRIVQSAISRRREYLADASGAKLTRYPEGLASALEKISGTNKGKMKVSEAVSHLFFVDPTHSALDSMFDTHPPVKQRIAKLRAM